LKTTRPWYSLRQGNIANNVFIHIAVWSIVIGLPLFFMNREDISWMHFLMFTAGPVSFMMVFYPNYIYLIDEFWFENKKGEFIVINIVLILCSAFFIQLWHEFLIALRLVLENPSLREGGGKGGMIQPLMPVVSFVIRDIFSLIMVVALSVAIKMGLRWAKIEADQKEMKQTLIEAELKNLKNQINPHFLLNTLNNIYALAQFNSPRLQPAIMDLSRLLQYMLYENNQQYVPLKEETGFIRNYIDLMRLRLPDSVDLSVNMSLLPDSNTMIAPLIFISLIENAFKHGVSAGEPSFIDISLTETDNHKVKFLCKNSFFPKGDSDKSGSGIGLQQVQKRLGLLYPERYIWHTEIKDNVYSVVLIINVQETGKETEK